MAAPFAGNDTRGGANWQSKFGQSWKQSGNRGFYLGCYTDDSTMYLLCTLSSVCIDANKYCKWIFVEITVAWLPIALRAMTVTCWHGDICGTRVDVCSNSRARTCSCSSDSFLYELTGPSGNNVWSNEIGWRDAINRENRISSIAIKSLFCHCGWASAGVSAFRVCACHVRSTLYFNASLWGLNPQTKSQRHGVLVVVGECLPLMTGCEMTDCKRRPSLARTTVKKNIFMCSHHQEKAADFFMPIQVSATASHVCIDTTHALCERVWVRVIKYTCNARHLLYTLMQIACTQNACIL